MINKGLNEQELKKVSGGNTHTAKNKDSNLTPRYKVGDAVLYCGFFATYYCIVKEISTTRMKNKKGKLQWKYLIEYTGSYSDYGTEWRFEYEIEDYE